MTDEITVCPECDSSDIDAVGAGSIQPGPRQPTFHCDGCDHRFDEPATRDAQAVTGYCGITRVLADADPDESPVEVARRAVGGGDA